MMALATEQRDVEDVGRRLRVAVRLDVVRAVTVGATGRQWIAPGRRLAVQRLPMLTGLNAVTARAVRARHPFWVGEAQPVVTVGAENARLAVQRAIVRLAGDHVARRVRLVSEKRAVLMTDQAEIVALSHSGVRHREHRRQQRVSSGGEQSAGRRCPIWTAPRTAAGTLRVDRSMSAGDASHVQAFGL